MNQEEKKVNEIHLECPHCANENVISLSSEIKCKKCEKELIGFKYKSIILSVSMLFWVGAVSGVLIDDSVNINRASLKTEFNMMATCLKEFKDTDIKTCACAVESMSGIFDVQQVRFRSASWQKEELTKRYYDCLN